MSQPEAFGFVFLILAIIGALAGAWWRVEAKVSDAKKETSRRVDHLSAESKALTAQLAAHKVHVAEHYISKQGHREATEQILDAIRRVTERLDRAFEANRSA